MFPNSSAMPLSAPETARTGWLEAGDPGAWPTLDVTAVPASVERQIERTWRVGSRRPPAAPSPQAPALPRAPLSPIARDWLQTLPAAARPERTARRHPHVINQLALAWDHPARRAACLRDLLLADRPDRQGFSFEVLDELVALQALDARG